jgi:RNA polymerase sigma factor (TIGR02999 family)
MGLPVGDITELLQQAQAGDTGAVERLFEALYPDLRRIARARLSGHQRHTLLDTTALVHECYLKFAGTQRLQPQDRRHFLAYASRAMRSVIVDFARERLAERRGGGQEHVPLGTTMSDRLSNPEEEILDVHGALEQLALAEPRLAQVVEMRYFGGLTEAEIADALEVTDRTVRRDWDKARLMLAAALRA